MLKKTIFITAIIAVTGCASVQMAPKEQNSTINETSPAVQTATKDDRVVATINNQPVMASELGDLNWLPISVRHRIESVYSEVAGSYLGWRRIEEGRPEDWFPTETSFDTVLLRDLGHFFSDYQASVKWLERIRQAVLLLGAIDTRKDSENYDRPINLILEKVEPRTTQREILTQLTTREDAPLS